MSSLEETFQAACRDREIPGAVLVATDRSGKFQYSESFGVCSLDDGREKPLEQNAIMGVASCTKLLTSIAALQCVEKGLLSLDEDVVRVLPEFKDVEVVGGIDEETGELKMKKAANAITLRLLLTHSSGISYDAVQPHLLKWRKDRGEQAGIGLTVASRFLYPLIFEPGTSWMYGAGHDWAGKMVERVNPGMTLETYFQKHIFQPLGIKDATFFVNDRDDLMARKPAMSVRMEQGGKVAPYGGPIPYEGVTDAMGGQGLYTCAPEYLKVLQNFLADDERLLKKESMAELFKPQLTDSSQKALMKLLEDAYLNQLYGATLPADCKKNWGLGGLLCLDHLPGWRNEGTLSWTGLPNLCWFIDRKAGLCGLYASQLMPPGDLKSVELQKTFEKAMYKRSGAVTARM